VSAGAFALYALRSLASARLKALALGTMLGLALEFALEGWNILLRTGAVDRSDQSSAWHVAHLTVAVATLVGTAVLAAACRKGRTEGLPA
jgi:hypothetical protein